MQSASPCFFIFSIPCREMLHYIKVSKNNRYLSYIYKLIIVSPCVCMCVCVLCEYRVCGPHVLLQYSKVKHCKVSSLPVHPAAALILHRAQIFIQLPFNLLLHTHTHTHTHTVYLLLSILLCLLSLTLSYTHNA